MTVELNVALVEFIVTAVPISADDVSFRAPAPLPLTEAHRWHRMRPLLVAAPVRMPNVKFQLPAANLP